VVYGNRRTRIRRQELPRLFRKPLPQQSSSLVASRQLRFYAARVAGRGFYADPPIQR